MDDASAGLQVTLSLPSVLGWALSQVTLGFDHLCSVEDLRFTVLCVRWSVLSTEALKWRELLTETRFPPFLRAVGGEGVGAELTRTALCGSQGSASAGPWERFRVLVLVDVSNPGK